jgi:hypothetical protein
MTDTELGNNFISDDISDYNAKRVGAMVRLLREALEQRWIGCLTSQEWIDEARKLVGEVKA